MLCHPIERNEWERIPLPKGSSQGYEYCQSLKTHSVQFYFHAQKGSEMICILAVFLTRTLTILLTQLKKQPKVSIYWYLMCSESGISKYGDYWVSHSCNLKSSSP